MAPRKVQGRRSSAAEALANAVRKHLDAAQQLSDQQDHQLKEKLQAEYAGGTALTPQLAASLSATDLDG